MHVRLQAVPPPVEVVLTPTADQASATVWQVVASYPSAAHALAVAVAAPGKLVDAVT